MSGQETFMNGVIALDDGEPIPSPPSPPRPVSGPSIRKSLQDPSPSAPAPAPVPGPSSASASTISKTDLILGVAVVDFNHLQGPIVEWSHPASLSDNNLHADLTSSLPFCALPDGSHLSDEDFAHFHLHCPSISRHSTVFGISCNRQIASEKLLVRGKDVTRSTVQKAVVVLARQPVFAPLREKLGIVTRAFFAQGDLADTAILVDFYETLELGLRAAGLKGEDVAEDDDFAQDEDEEDRASEDEGDTTLTKDKPPTRDLSATTAPVPPSRDEQSQADELREGVMYMGTSLRELIFKFRFKTLIMVKLLLLQKRLMFFGYPVERLCVYEYTLVSLIPGLLLSLSDCSSPELDYTKRHHLKTAEDVKTSDRHSLLRFCGCPLRLFGEDAFFQPYLPLQQIELLRARTWLVGTTNLIFKQQKEFRPDVVVDLETSTLEYLTPRTAASGPSQPRTSTSSTSSDSGSFVPVEMPPPGITGSNQPTQQQPSLQSIVALTPADRKWMDELVHVVVESYNPEDPSRPTTLKYEGSEDWIRARFEDYICSFLACVKYSTFLGKSNPDPFGAAATSGNKAGTSGTTSGAGAAATIEAPDAYDAIHAYGPLFIDAFKTTAAHSIWDQTTSALLFDLVPYRHPCGGKVSTLEDVGLRLSAGLYDLKLDEQLHSGREALGNAGRGLWDFANRAGMEVAKRRREWIAQQQAQQQQQKQATVIDATMSAGTSAATTPKTADSAGAVDLQTRPASTHAPSSPSLVGGLPSNVAPHAQAAQQAAIQAGTEVRAAFGRFSSYLGSRGWGGGAGSGSGTPQ